jgi:hypothetical protein
MEELARK